MISPCRWSLSASNPSLSNPTSSMEQSLHLRRRLSPQKAIVQKAVDDLDPSDEETVWAAVKQCWDNVPMTFVNNLVGSFERRLRKCVAMKGATITTKTAKGERDL